MKNFNLKKRNLKKENGFTLMELLVVVALLMIILSVSLFNYDKFGKDVELENAVYSVALAIREAQVYGVNKALKDVSEPENSFGGSYGYGAYFNKENENPSLAADKKKFLLFIDDVSNNQVFNGDCLGGENDECFSQIYLTKGNYISNIEVFDNDEWTLKEEVNIFFKRPNPDAVIKISTDTYSKARITISSPGEVYKRCIIIGAAGDITITRSCN